MICITDSERLEALKKLLELTLVDRHEGDGYLKLDNTYFQFEGAEPTIDAAINYLVVEMRNNPHLVTRC